MKFKGTVHRYGRDIDTDVIIPARYLNTSDPAELAKHCLEDLDTEFVNNVQPGDIIVAGRNFGCGSSREHAPIALLNMGAKAVIADSFARIFFRNAVNLGLVPVICKGISKKVKEGQTLTLDFVKGVVTVQETGESYPCEALGEQAMKILAAGGIKPLMRARFAKEKAEQKAE